MDVALENLPDFARDFVAALPARAGARAHVVGLRGDLGAGKTAFVQAVARELGVQGVTSPTFVLAQRYAIEHPAYTSLIHIDAYRLKPEESHTMGWGRFVADSKNLILVEWPENIGDQFPKDAKILNFSVIDDVRRAIAYAE